MSLFLTIVGGVFLALQLDRMVSLYFMARAMKRNRKALDQLAQSLGSLNAVNINSVFEVPRELQ